MILVIMSQILAGFLVDRFTDLGIGMPVTVVGVVMILALCFVKLLGTDSAQSLLRLRRLRKEQQNRQTEDSPTEGLHEKLPESKE